MECVLESSSRPLKPHTVLPRRPAANFGGVGHLVHALIAYAPRRIALALLLLFVAGMTEAFGLLMLVPLLYVLDAANQPGNPGFVVETVARAAAAVGVELTLPVVLVVFLALAAVRSATAWQREVVLAGIRLGFVRHLQGRMYTAVAGSKWHRLLGRRQSDVQHVLLGGVDRIGQSVSVMLQLVVTSVLALVQLALAVLIAPAVSAAVLVTGATLLFLTRSMMRRSRTLGEELTGANRMLYGSVTDFLGGLKLAKSYNAERTHVEHFLEAIETVRRRRLAFTWAAGAARAVLSMGSAVALAGLIWFSASTVTLTMPELLLMVLIFSRVLPGLLRLQQNAQQLAHLLPAYSHVRAMYRSLRGDAEAAAGDGETRMALHDALAVRDVSFAYETGAGAEAGCGTETGPDAGSEAEATAGTAAPVLKDVSLKIPAGKITAIAGPSGSGKSTLADILLGLLEPRGGEVRVDGVPLAGSNTRRWRRSVAGVFQDPYLFHGTIRENLRWARPEATEAEMWRALRLAAAEEFVAALPKGLDTVTGDRGGWLSGGERQRIALARALIREPALLVLDEATSQLDAENERQILAVLESLRGRTTVVVIAHRPALLEGADRVVLLKSGRIAASGAWCDLAAEPAVRDAGAHGRFHPARPPGNGRDPALEGSRRP